MSTEAVSTARLNTLVDGIFAIVLTLLVLDIRVPEATSNSELVSALVDLWPQLFSYALSFIIIGLFWLGHQLESRYIHSSDHLRTWLTLVFVMFVALLPFSSSLLGSHPFSLAAVIVYSSNVCAASLLRYLHWRYVSNHHRLVSRDLDQRLIASVSRAFLSTPLLCLLVIALSLISVKASLVLLIISVTNILFRISHISHHFAK